MFSFIGSYILLYRYISCFSSHYSYGFSCGKRERKRKRERLSIYFPNNFFFFFKKAAAGDAGGAPIFCDCNYMGILITSSFLLKNKICLN